jgi:hypothetical protein
LKIVPVDGRTGDSRFLVLLGMETRAAKAKAKAKAKANAKAVPRTRQMSGVWFVTANEKHFPPEMRRNVRVISPEAYLKTLTSA